MTYSHVHLQLDYRNQIYLKVLALLEAKYPKAVDFENKQITGIFFVKFYNFSLLLPIY